MSKKLTFIGPNNLELGDLWWTWLCAAQTSFKEGTVVSVAGRAVSEESSAANYFSKCLSIFGPLYSRPHLYKDDPHATTAN